MGTQQGLFQGSMDVIRGDILHGWLFSPLPAVLPLLFADDVPATLVGDHLPRPDVAEALGVNDDTGFAFRLPATRESATLSLYAVTPDGVILVEQRQLGVPVCERDFTAQLERAATMARQPGAVGIVCWDGANNPVGRAKVLYDIVARKRPAVLFCYLHREFGGALWPPLLNSDLPVVTIPWERRESCEALLRRAGVVCDTVWICKPRLPSFRLAATISRPESRHILDMDDDEEAFMIAQTSRAEYNAPGRGLARELTACVASRTVVSPTLQERFGGVLVRHARQPRGRAPKTAGGVRKIAFIGTVRAHKNVLALAKALRLTAFATRLSLEFHVYGDIQPPEYREALAANGVVLRDFLPARELAGALADMDAVITAFPAMDDTARAIAAAQVSAKISDALAVGIPVLTPDTPAIADLRDVPGVYPYALDNFREQLLAALRHDAPVALPEDFTLDGAYAAFETAERQARPMPELRALLPEATPEPSSVPALILFWKQNDAGLYGRRVDQIARSYKRRFPDHRVFLLELHAATVRPGLETVMPPQGENCTDETALKERLLNLYIRTASRLESEAAASSQAEDFTDETARKEALLERKLHGWDCDGILLQTLCYGDEQALRTALADFLARHGLLPDNTVVVLFPIIQDLRHIADMLRPYPTVIDVVDNQMSWATDDARRCFVLDQYFRLLAPAAHVVCNAENARAFFVDRHFLDNVADVRVIPNWYTPPDGAVLRWEPPAGRTLHIFYSGNMNDRLDWDLLHAVAALPDVRLHLAGTAKRASVALDELLARNGVVYHGVTAERETLALLRRMDAALVPHVLDAVSVFMHPIKIQMYQAVGLPVLCPAHLAVAGETVLSYADAPDCLQKITTLRRRTAPDRQKLSRERRTWLESTEDAYLALLSTLRGG